MRQIDLLNPVRPHPIARVESLGALVCELCERKESERAELEQAAGCTHFLDEVGEMSMSARAKVPTRLAGARVSALTDHKS